MKLGNRKVKGRSYRKEKGQGVKKGKGLHMLELIRSLWLLSVFE